MVIKPLVLFICFVFVGCLKLSGQNNYPIRGTVFIREGKATKVKLIVNTQQRQIKVPVDLEGNFSVYLEWNRDYRFSFSKLGYVSKCIDFSTNVPQSTDKSGIFPYELLVELFPVFPDVDTVFFKNPVAKIHFNHSYNDFDFDTNYQLSIQNKLEKANSDYYKWNAKTKASVKPKKEELTKKQELLAIHYTRAIEGEKKQAVPPPKSKSIIQPKTEDSNNPFGLPLLKKQYPEGKTIEIHLMTGKEVTRVIIKKGAFQKIFYKVKHDWGGLYYFVQESPTHYRSISKYNFDKSTSN